MSWARDFPEGYMPPPLEITITDPDHWVSEAAGQVADHWALIDREVTEWCARRHGDASPET